MLPTPALTENFQISKSTMCSELYSPIKAVFLRHRICIFADEADHSICSLRSTWSQGSWSVTIGDHPPAPEKKHTRSIKHQYCQSQDDCCGWCSVTNGLQLQRCVHKEHLLMKGFRMKLHSSRRSGGPRLLENS